MYQDFSRLGMMVDTAQIRAARNEVKGFAGDAARTSKQVETATGKMERSFRGVRSAVGLALAAVSAMAGGLSVLPRFERSISQVGAISRATATELAAMRDVATELGASTEFSATQAAGGLRFLAQAGFTAKESIAALPDVLNLATAAQMDLAEAADISSNIMSAFGIAATDAAAVADVLASASSRANTDVSQLGAAMAYVGPVASALGISVNDAASAVGVLSDAGIQGSAAGTGLRRVLSSLANPTKEARDVLSGLGLTMGELNPATNSLTDIVNRLSNAGLDAADALTVFGDRGGPAILALTSQAPRLEELTGELKNVDGEASRMADTMRDNLGGDLDSLMSALEGLIIALGDAGLTAALRTAIQILTGLARAASMVVDWFDSLIRSTRDYVDELITVGDTLSQTAAATETVNTQMAAEIALLTEVTEGLSGGTVMSRDAAKAKLDEAEAIRAKILQGQAELEQIAKQSSAYKTLQNEIAGWQQKIEEAKLDQATSPEATWLYTKEDLEEMIDGLEQAQAEASRLVLQAGQLPPEYEAASRMIETLRNALENSVGETVRLGGETGTVASIADRLQAILAALPGTISAASGSAGGLAGALGRAATAALGLFSAVRSVVSLLGPMASGLGRLSVLGNAVSTATGAMGTIVGKVINSTGLKNAVKVLGEVGQTIGMMHNAAVIAAPGIEDLNDKLGGGGGGTAKAADKAKTEIEAFNDKMKEAAFTAEEFGERKASILVRGIDGIADAWGNFVARGFKDFKGFVKDILSSFSSMISQMISMAAKNRIMMSLGFGGVEGGVLNGAKGALGAASGPLGQVSGIVGKVSGFVGGIGSGLAQALGFGKTASAGLFAISQNAAAAAGGVATLGSTIGAALPVIGIAAAAFSFFRSKTAELNTGLRVTTEGMEALVETFRTVEKTKFWGLSKKVSTSYEKASRDVADPIQSAINTIGERVMALSDILGLASDNLAKTSFKFEVSTKDKSDAEIQEAIQGELKRLGNDFADAVIGSYTEYLPDEAEIARIDKAIKATYNIGGKGGEWAGESRRAALETQRTAAETAIEITHLNDTFAELQREGEGSLDTLERVVGSLQTVNEMLYLFDRRTLEMSVAGAAAAAKLAELAGGLEAFTSKTQYVFDNFLTDAGRDARLTEIALADLKATFGDLSLAVPETHAEFTALLEAQDLTTEAGRQTTVALMDVASAFVQVRGTAQEAADRLRADREAQVASARDVLTNRAQNASDALADAEAALRRAFEAERERVSAAYEDQIDAAQASADAARASTQSARETAQDRVSLYRSIVDALENAYSSRKVLTAIGEQMRLGMATQFLRNAVGAGGTADYDGLKKALDVVADPSTSLFESFADYQQSFNVNTNLIDQLRSLSEDQLSIEQRMLNGIEDQERAITDSSRRQIDALRDASNNQLASLDAQLAALLGIDDSVLSLEDAISGLKTAQKAVEQTSGATPEPATRFQTGSFGEKLDNAYQQYLGRGVQQPGLDFYGGLWASGTAWETILSDIIFSEEAKQYRATGIPRFAGGGYTGDGARTGGLDGQGGFLAMMHPQETVLDHTKLPILGMDRVEQLITETNDRIRSLQVEIIKQNQILRDWNVNGMPGTRSGDVVKVEGNGDQNQIMTEEVA